MKEKILTALLILILILLLPGCATVSERQIYVMDSVAAVRVYPENADVIDEMCNTLYVLDDAFSAYDGEVYSINEAGGGILSEHTKNLLESSLLLSEETGGAFSPFLGTVIDLWGVGSKNYVPSEKEITEALSVCCAENAALYGNSLTLKKGLRINFGATAKGYASDVLRDILLENEIDGAVISLGGNVYVHGTRDDGSPWRVALRDPEGAANDYFGTLALRDKFVISSGDYERFFENEGKVYHHIIDPKTGCPAESDLRAVCVVGNSGVSGDAYSTALYVMGKEKALSFWRAHDELELVLVGRDGCVTLTEGLYDSFTPNEEKRYEYEIARR